MEKWEEDSVCDDYQLESCVFDYEEVKQHENFGIKKYQDAIYRGELQNGKRNGLGVDVTEDCVAHGMCVVRAD